MADRARDARAGIVHRLHEQIDAAVAEAYGWPADLTPSEIVTRLVALNGERAKEEAEGNIRWLRPEYQIPRFANGTKPAPGNPKINNPTGVLTTGVDKSGAPTKDTRLPDDMQISVPGWRNW